MTARHWNKFINVWKLQAQYAQATTTITITRTKEQHTVWAAGRLRNMRGGRPGSNVSQRKFDAMLAAYSNANHAINMQHIQTHILPHIHMQWPPSLALQYRTLHFDKIILGRVKFCGHAMLALGRPSFPLMMMNWMPMTRQSFLSQPG